MVKAYDRAIDSGATVEGVLTMVDRGDIGSQIFGKLGVRYTALVTYRDLGIKSVGGSPLLTPSR